MIKIGVIRFCDVWFIEAKVLFAETIVCRIVPNLPQPEVRLPQSWGLHKIGTLQDAEDGTILQGEQIEETRSSLCYVSGASSVHAGRGGVLPRRGGAGAGWLAGPPAALQGREAGPAPPPARLLQ